MTEKSAWERDRDELLARRPENARAYDMARTRYEAIARFIDALEQARAAQRLSKAEIARRVGMPAPSVRRFFTQSDPNPSLAVSLMIADAVGLDFVLRKPAAKKQANPKAVPVQRVLVRG